MKRTLGPWTGMTVDQGTTFILRAMLAFKARNDRWPLQSDPPDPLLAGLSWGTANSWLFTKGNSLLKLRGAGACEIVWSVALWQAEARKYKLATGDYPHGESGAWSGFGGRTWHTANLHVCKPAGLTVHELLAELYTEDLVAFRDTNQRLPHCDAPTSEEKRLRNHYDYLLRHTQFLPLLAQHDLLPKPRGKRVQKLELTLENVESAVRGHLAATGCVPTSATGRCDVLGCSWSTAAHWAKDQGVSLRGLAGAPELSTLENKGDICLASHKKLGRWPIESEPGGPELRYLRKSARKGSNIALQQIKRIGAPLHADRSDSCSIAYLKLTQDELQTRGDKVRARHGKLQFPLLGCLVARLARCWRSQQCTPNVEGDSGGTLHSLLAQASKRPSQTRGLGLATDRCQVRTLARANLEIEHDCWRFTLKGAKKPDKRPWSAILVAGDNVKIETAERIAFLDWENPDAAGKPVRRPWSPPATQPEAGKPAPANGKGKRASTKA